MNNHYKNKKNGTIIKVIRKDHLGVLVRYVLTNSIKPISKAYFERNYVPIKDVNEGTT